MSISAFANVHTFYAENSSNHIIDKSHLWFDEKTGDFFLKLPLFPFPCKSSAKDTDLRTAVTESDAILLFLFFSVILHTKENRIAVVHTEDRGSRTNFMNKYQEIMYQIPITP